MYTDVVRLALNRGALQIEQSGVIGMSQTVSPGIDLEPLRSVVAGEVIAPGDEAYDEARGVWNGMIDRYPAAVVRCESSSDVAAAISFARDNDLPLAVRCGGHSTPGYSTCDAGIVIDLRPMNAVQVDPERRTARVQGGTPWAGCGPATQEYGPAGTGRRVSHPGGSG